MLHAHAKYFFRLSSFSHRSVSTYLVRKHLPHLLARIDNMFFYSPGSISIIFGGFALKHSGPCRGSTTIRPNIMSRKVAPGSMPFRESEVPSKRNNEETGPSKFVKAIAAEEAS